MRYHLCLPFAFLLTSCFLTGPSCFSFSSGLQYTVDMSVNSSSSSNDSLDYYCSNSKGRLLILNSLSAIKTILLLPLCAFILYLGFQQWQQHGSFQTASHSDLFTYHLSAMELIWVFGSVFYLCGIYCYSSAMIVLGSCVFSFVFYGEMFFHVLTCVERYLAVVHPITYLGLRTSRGVRIRNICIGCVWLLSFGLLGAHADLTGEWVLNTMLLFLVFSIIVISFCSLSVLCALIRPGPGEGGGEDGRVDQSKQRAFHTVTAISSVLWLWFIGLLVTSPISKTSLLSEEIACVLTVSFGYFNLPCCLVSPLLYLHKAGKLSCRHFECG